MILKGQLLTAHNLNNAYLSKTNTSSQSVVGSVTFMNGLSVTGALSVSGSVTSGGTALAKESITISAGTGLTGGGSLAQNRTLSLATSGVTAGTYGSTSQTVEIKVDAYGRITSAVNKTISISSSNLSSAVTVAKGGTGRTSFTAGGIIYASASTTISQIASPTKAGQYIKSTGVNTYGLSDFETDAKAAAQAVFNANLPTVSKNYLATILHNSGTPSLGANTNAEILNLTDGGIKLTRGSSEYPLVLNYDKASTESINSIFSSGSTSGPDLNIHTANKLNLIGGKGFSLKTGSGAGTEKVTITNAGNVGIGSTSPSALLHVLGGQVHITSSAGGDTTISDKTYAIVVAPKPSRIQTANSYYGGIAFNQLLNHNGAITYNKSPQAWVGTRLTSTAGSELAALVFATKEGTTADDIPIERMAILHTGNVGIGTMTPAEKLHVQGNARVGLGTSADAYIELWRGTSASWRQIVVSGTYKLQSNYTSAVGSYYDALTVAYNTGNTWIKGTLTTGGKINNATISGGTLSGGTFSGGTVSGGTWNSTKSTYLGQDVRTTATPTFASMTLTGDSAERLTINRTNNSGNSTVSIKTTAGTIYVGNANGSTFAIGTTADINSGGKFKVNASTGNVTAGTYNGATISGGTLSGGTVSGGTWNSTKSGYLNQAVLTTSSPTFANLTITTNLTVNGSISQNGSGGSITSNSFIVADPGYEEGIKWAGGNGWKIFESPDDLTNTAGNLQFVQNSTRRMTIRTDGKVDAPSGYMIGKFSIEYNSSEESLDFIFTA